jgi:hypothetical protein
MAAPPAQRASDSALAVIQDLRARLEAGIIGQQT